MLDTTSSNDCPLFSTSTMAMTSGIVIQRPLPTESYSWSDFPMVLQDDSASATTFCSHHCGYEYSMSSSSGNSNNNNSMSSSNNYPSMASTSTSTLSTASSTSTMSVASVSASSSSLSSASSKKNVRFAPSPKVRTYSVVLGDHPLCDDGLAIELGWDYSDEDENHENDGTELEDSMEEDVLRHSRNSCQKRSYLSRKQLLLDVAGCTKEELDQRTKDLETQRSLRQQAQAYRDDYYYLLAFAKR